MSLLAQDIITGELFIKEGDKYHEFRSGHWDYYNREGTLVQLVSELKAKGIEVPKVWNTWGLQDEVWTLTIHNSEPMWFHKPYPTVIVWGEPGLSPSEQEKELAIEAYEIDLLVEEEEDAQWEIKRTQEEEELALALKGMIGAKVIKFMPPDEEYSSGYIILETREGYASHTGNSDGEKGKLLKITSGHEVWNYGEESRDFISVHIVTEDELEE